MGKKDKKKKKNKGYEINPMETFYNMYVNAIRQNGKDAQNSPELSREDFERLYQSYRNADSTDDVAETVSAVDNMTVDDIIADDITGDMTGVQDETTEKKDKKNKKDKKEKNNKDKKNKDKKKKKEKSGKSDKHPSWDGDRVAAMYAENVAGNQIARRLGAAEAMLQEPEKLAVLLDRVEETLHSLKMMQMNLRLKTNHNMPAENYDTVDRIVEKAPVLMELMRSYQSGEFTELTEEGLVGIVASFIYLEDDDTLIPDTIPAIGYLDDLSVLKLAEQVAEADLVAYSAWKAGRTEVMTQA